MSDKNRGGIRFNWVAYWLAGKAERRAARTARLRVTTVTGAAAQRGCRVPFQPQVAEADDFEDQDPVLTPPSTHARHRFCRAFLWESAFGLGLLMVLAVQWTLSCALLANGWASEDWVLAQTARISPAGEIFTHSPAGATHANVRLRALENEASGDDVVLWWAVDSNTQRYLIAQDDWKRLESTASARHLVFPNQENCIKSGACQRVRWGRAEAFLWLWAGQRPAWMNTHAFAHMPSDALTQRWFQGLAMIFGFFCFLIVPAVLYGFRRWMMGLRALDQKGDHLLLWAVLLNTGGVRRAPVQEVLVFASVFFVFFGVENTALFSAGPKSWGVTALVCLVQGALVRVFWEQASDARGTESSRQNKRRRALRIRLERGAVLREHAQLRRAMTGSRAQKAKQWIQQWRLVRTRTAGTEKGELGRHYGNEEENRSHSHSPRRRSRRL